MIPKSKLFDLMYDLAAFTDSCITSPSLPVICILPFPGIVTVSIFKISPPYSVQAKPVTIPILSTVSNSPDLNFGTPKKSDRGTNVFVLSVTDGFNPPVLAEMTLEVE